MVKGFIISNHIWVIMCFQIVLKNIHLKHYFRKQSWNHIVRCMNAIKSGKEMPKLSLEEDKFNRKISFFEAITESLWQFTISDILIRLYGVSDDMTTKFFQLFSLASSMLSLIVAFITVCLSLYCLIFGLSSNIHISETKLSKTIRNSCT